MIASTLVYIKKFCTSIDCDTIMENDNAVKISITINDNDNGTNHTYLINVNTTLRFLKKRFCEINGTEMEDLHAWVDYSYNTNSIYRLEDDDKTIEEYILLWRLSSLYYKDIATNLVVHMAADCPENHHYIYQG